ncbi:MAG: SDR family NAD(P)-dependent oxidoreductase, partial [Thermodesulfobacteriota bacterium]
MEDRFNHKDADLLISQFSESNADLVRCIHITRLIGLEPDLVLHGGGNSSVKVIQSDILGEPQHIIYVKGSGRNMATISPSDFCPLNLDPLRHLHRLKSLSDDELENQLGIHRLSIKSPEPSVEALLHAFLPHRYVMHTHADSLLIIGSQKGGRRLIKQVMGDDVAVLPYIASGFPLAGAVADSVKKSESINAVIVCGHGAFTFAENAETVYRRMIRLVTRAELFIESRSNRSLLKAPQSKLAPSLKEADRDLARVCHVIRGACSDPTESGTIRRCCVEVRRSKEMIQASLNPIAETLCRTGVITPDHVLWTKNRIVFIPRIPEEDHELNSIIQKAVSDFIREYRRYLNPVKEDASTIPSLDLTPVLFLVSGLGLIAAGSTWSSTRIAADIGEKTILIKLKSHALGDFRPISKNHVIRMETWSLQKKKKKEFPGHPLIGQVAVITGAGGAIGFGIAKQLLKAGAAVALTDIDSSRLETSFSLLFNEFASQKIERFLLDVTQEDAVVELFNAISLRFGGIDILVPNAGIAHVARIEELDSSIFDKVIAVNLKGTVN